MNGAFLPSQADAPPHVGLLERVEFQGRVLDQLIRYQNEMRQWFTRRLEELSNDVRGPQPIQEFPPFDHWVEMQMKSNARISTHWVATTRPSRVGRSRCALRRR